MAASTDKPIYGPGTMTLENTAPAEPVDMVNHPPHYTSSEAECSNCGHPIECIDVIEHQPLNIGNAIKYVWRLDLKHADGGIEDLNKSIWYLKRELQRRLKKLGKKASNV